jgi:hypothetical protein
MSEITRKSYEAFKGEHSKYLSKLETAINTLEESIDENIVRDNLSIFVRTEYNEIYYVFGLPDIILDCHKELLDVAEDFVKDFKAESKLLSIDFYKKSLLECVKMEEDLIFKLDIISALMDRYKDGQPADGEKTAFDHYQEFTLMVGKRLETIFA